MAGDKIPITEIFDKEAEKCRSCSECKESAGPIMSTEEKISNGIANILNTTKCLAATLDDFETYFFSVMYSGERAEQKIHPSVSASLVRDMEVVYAYIERIERRLADIGGEL